MDDQQRAVVVGISGCSSSGKTTLARLLRDMFPGTFILHQDDFYKTEDQLPMKEGLLDWDCPEAISVPDMEQCLAHIRSTGAFPVSLTTSSSPPLSQRADHGCCPPPPTPLNTATATPASSSLTTALPPSPPALQTALVDSKEDQNSVGACPAAPERIAAAAARVQAWLRPGQPGSLVFSPPTSSKSPSPPPPKVCLLDGFLLYSPDTAVRAIMSAIDIKLFLLVSRAKATRRREARDGYVTLEGFWKDPPGYVDKIVWPNYAAAHAWLFAGGDVERGVLDPDAAARYGILVPGIQQGVAATGEGGASDGGVDVDVDFADILDWAVDTLMRKLEEVVLGMSS
ncbi:P-loop containing nucleoside triphosphate hydrolase protein [Lasiosphaeria miniovina]|uniref:P-loop containing nucleoside triphosphate hydrolase protein n=1 Tax=Lasiosphaeria miniovina TaxID=1954250 RepID=A0AA40DQ04_9PEZI|nr:P-loop containing nucleoside triphosphate hydrolase protein [Lasiosphaeria miniovina]KAK0708997.1 P-loop containing nucleoside triphosphate hydrolase protein [Lasiosphaeria miniovina]